MVLYSMVLYSMVLYSKAVAGLYIRGDGGGGGMAVITKGLATSSWCSLPGTLTCIIDASQALDEHWSPLSH